MQLLPSRQRKIIVARGGSISYSEPSKMHVPVVEELDPETAYEWSSGTAVKAILRDTIRGTPHDLIYDDDKLLTGPWGKILALQCFNIISLQCHYLFLQLNQFIDTVDPKDLADHRRRNPYAVRAQSSLYWLHDC